MTPCTHIPSAMPGLYMHWNVVLSPSTRGLSAPQTEDLHVLPGDTLIFTGAPAIVTFPPGTTVPASRSVPGTFRINAEAEDGDYAFCIDPPFPEPIALLPQHNTDQDAVSTHIRFRIGPGFSIDCDPR